MNHFLLRVDKSLTKFETIFNLFWMRAGEAELRGMNHKDVLKITNKALAGIKNELNEYKNEIIKEYDIVEKKRKKRIGAFRFNITELEKKGEELENIEVENKRVLKNIITNFLQEIEKSYKEFENIFIKSMNQDIELKKVRKDDSDLIKNTQNKMIQIWKKLDKSFDQFKKDMDKLYKSMG